MPKNVKRGPFGLVQRPFSCKISKKWRWTLWGHWKKIQKNTSQSRKGCGESLIAPKKWKGGPFCFRIVFLEALGAFKMKYQVLLVKVHNAQKVIHTGWGWRKKKKTSRDRPKSAPYLRLKNTKRKVSQCREKLKGGPFGIFQNPFCPKISKNWRWDPSVKKKFSKKKSHRAENTLWPRWVS